MARTAAAHHGSLALRPFTALLVTAALLLACAPAARAFPVFVSLVIMRASACALPEFKCAPVTADPPPPPPTCARVSTRHTYKPTNKNKKHPKKPHTQWAGGAAGGSNCLVHPTATNFPAIHGAPHDDR